MPRTIALDDLRPRVSERLAKKNHDTFTAEVRGSFRRGSSLAYPFDVRHSRLIAGARRRLNEEGYNVHAWTSLSDSEVHVWVSKGTRFAFPSRTRNGHSTKRR